jgi:hypothetical protein
MSKSRFRVGPPNQGKRVTANPGGDLDVDRLPPKFCLRRLRSGYSLTDCTKDEKVAFADRLYDLSRNSWAALRQMPRHGQGWEIIERNSIKGDVVPTDISADVHIIAFRCIGKKPMVGYRSADGVFNILWIDRASTLYNHG